LEMSSVIFIAHPPTPDPRWRDDITNSSVTSASDAVDGSSTGT
jgi:hypothetical protein